ncbi:MAG: hypothetical protein V3S64_00055 [bacterium]
MFRKLLWLIFAIGISGAFIYGYEAFLMDSFTGWLTGFSSETIQNAPSEVQGKIDPFLGGIITGASFAAKGFAALIGITVANVIFGK